MPGNTSRVQKTIVLIVILLVIVCIGVVIARQASRITVRTITGTIKQIDPATRTATLTVVRPKTGQLMEITGQVPPECEIFINGAPAALSDLHVGEQVEVEGTIHPDRSISANWVRVTRPVETQPSTQP